MRTAEARAEGPARTITLRSPGLMALGVIGLALAALVTWSPPTLGAFNPPPSIAARTIIVACAAAVGLVALLSGPGVDRGDLLVSGTIALGGLAALVALAEPAAIAVVILMLGGLHARLPSRRSYVLRMRGPAVAAVLLGMAWLLIHTGSVGAHRVGALALALTVVAAAGLVPYVQDLDPEEPVASSCLSWAGFLAPPLALVLPVRVLPLSSDELVVFSITLVGLGLLNLAWGTVGAWRAGSELEAWRHSFLADWGLVLVGLGIGVLGPTDGDARGAAYLVVLSIVLVRFPVFFWARQVEHVREQEGARLVLSPSPQPSRAAPESPRNRGDGRRISWGGGREGESLGTLNVLLGAAMSGAAPFAGFPVRLLLLQAATRVAWPLAAALLVAMVVWVVHAFRLGRTLGRPTGRLAVGISATLSISLVLGLASGALLEVVRP